MLSHLIVEAACCRSRYRYHGGSGYGDYWVFSWLWAQIHYWSILVYGVIVSVMGWLRGFLGIGDND